MLSLKHKIPKEQQTEFLQNLSEFHNVLKQLATKTNACQPRHFTGEEFSFSDEGSLIPKESLRDTTRLRFHVFGLPDSGPSLQDILANFDTWSLAEIDQSIKDLETIVIPTLRSSLNTLLRKLVTFAEPEVKELKDQLPALLTKLSEEKKTELSSIERKEREYASRRLLRRKTIQEKRAGDVDYQNSRKTREKAYEKTEKESKEHYVRMKAYAEETEQNSAKFARDRIAFYEQKLASLKTHLLEKE